MSTFDEIDVSEKETTEPQFEFEYLVGDLEMLAKYYIDLYFSDKELPSGVTKQMLHSKDNISKVLNLDICSGMEQVYKLIGVDYDPDQQRHFERQGQLPDDVKYVISMLHDCSKRGIPKQFAIGIFLIYLEMYDKYRMAA